MSPLQHSCEVPIPTASSGRYAGIAAELTSHPGMREGDAGARVWLGFCYIGASGSINGCTLRMCLCGFGQVMADLIQSRGKASRHGACRSLRKIGAEQNPLYPPEVRLYPSLSLSLSAFQLEATTTPPVSLSGRPVCPRFRRAQLVGHLQTASSFAMPPRV